MPELTDQCVRCKKTCQTDELRTLSELGMSLVAISQMGLPKDE